MNDSPSTGRRKFLLQCGQAAGLLWLPAVNGEAAATQTSDLHLKPQYRENTPLDTVLKRVDALSDTFPEEEFYQQVSPILNGWANAFAHSVEMASAIKTSLASDFTGASYQLQKIDFLHKTSNLQVARCFFSAEPSLTPQVFLERFQKGLTDFSRFVSVDLQVTRVEGATTTVFYEWVAEGDGFYREQRTGTWQIEWRSGQVIRWLWLGEETRCRSTKAAFDEVTDLAFGANDSYRRQLLYGADHWRSVLDGACGIDIYGHNGVSAGALCGSELDDVYICQPGGLPNRLYRNRGDGTFEDVTEASGLGLLDNTACALIADFDNDGRQDIVVVRATGPLLYLNQGYGRFELKKDAFQFAEPPQGTFTGASAADYDGDGNLDIYFCLYVFYQGADQYKYPTPYFAAENGPPNFMMRNDGRGNFQDVTAASGMNKNNTRYSFCCAWGDYNQDGKPDLYVVNDFGRKNLYRNNGDGTFTDMAGELAVADVGAGMSVCWADIDSRATEDLYVADMWTAAGERISNMSGFQKSAAPAIQALYRKHAMGNSLFRNNEGRFTDISAASHTTMGRWSWSSDVWDLETDAQRCIYIANGMISGANRTDLNSFFWREVVAKSPNTAKSSLDYEQGWNAINELIREGYSWSGLERNVLYLPHHDGTYSNVAGALGLDFSEDSRTFVLADFEGDGRQEMLLKNRNAPQIRLVKNNQARAGNTISFRLSGVTSNRDAIGAAVQIGRQRKFIQAGSGFLAQHSKELFFCLPNEDSAVTAVIHWPSGMVQKLDGLRTGHRISIKEGEAPRQTAFRKSGATQLSHKAKVGEEALDTWLLIPVPAPVKQRQVPCLVTIDAKTDADTAAIYNLLFRRIYDNHRDLILSTSFLIDEDQQVQKVYGRVVEDHIWRKDLHGRPKMAEERIRRALPFEGNSANYSYGRNYLSLGSVYFQHGYVDPAEIYFSAALADNPKSAEALYGLGSVYLRQANNEKARNCFERAVISKADYPETLSNTWNNLGLIAGQQGDAEGAIVCFDKALRLDPNHFIVLVNLGTAYRQEKNWEDARASFLRALSIKTDDAEANYGLAMVYAQTNSSEQAQDYFQRALQIRPNYPEALNNLGILYLRTKRRDEAVANFQKCIQSAPLFDQAYFNLARVYTLEGRRDQARHLLQQLLSLRPEDEAAKQLLEQLTAQ